MTSTSFHDRLLAETTRRRAAFVAIPVISDTLERGVDLALYLDFLASAYHHVRHTCPLLGLALSHCGPDDAVYRAGLLHYLEEEKGHEEWILDDIAALGGNRAAVARTVPPLAVRTMVAYAYFAIERVSPYALLGMVHVLEGMSVALARAAAGAIREGLNLSGGSGGFSYLNSHGLLDEEHVDQFAKLLEGIDSPARRAVVIQAAKDFYQLYGDVFRALSGTKEISHAA